MSSIFVKRCVLITLILLTVGFIWSNSAKNAELSSNDSSLIVNLIKPLIDPHDKINLDVFTGFVRKAAHFSEFALLGGEICLLVVTLEKKRFSLPVSVVCVIVFATVDELIQLCFPGRSAAFTDVLIDTAGGFFGALFALFLVWSVKKIHLNLDIVKK